MTMMGLYEYLSKDTNFDKEMFSFFVMDLVNKLKI